MKVIRAERLARPGAALRFVSEARHSMGLQHGNIVAVFDFGRSEDGYYLAMEWVDGVDLSSLVADEERLPPEVAAHVTAEVARALAYAHGLDAPLVHCDVKPANVLVSRAGDVKLADFGLATVSGREEGRIRGGTPGYMPPEQEACGAVEPRSDLYALGIVLARLLTGDEDPAAIEDEELRALAGRLTERAIEDRPASATEVANALEAFVARARAGGAPSPREVLAARVRIAAEREGTAGSGGDENRELQATASFVRDGDSALLETLSRAGTVSAVTDSPDVSASARSAGAVSANRVSAGRVSASTVSASTVSASTPAPAPSRPASGRILLTVGLGVAVIGALGWLLSGLGRVPGTTEPGTTAAPAPSATGPTATFGPDRSGEAAEGAATTESSVPIASPSPIVDSPIVDSPVVDSPATEVSRVAEAIVARAAVPRSVIRARAPRPSPPADPAPVEEPPALLSINAVPWAYVTVDGRALGETPLFGVEIAPGRHRLRFEHRPSEAVQERTIDVASGERRAVVVDLTASNRASPAAVDALAP